MLKRLILVLALMVGAFAMTQGPVRATPLGASAGAPTAAPEQVQKAYYYYYRRRYRPRRHFYRRYYRPRYYYYRPRYRVYRYYRPRYYYRPRFYRFF